MTHLLSWSGVFSYFFSSSTDIIIIIQDLAAAQVIRIIPTATLEFNAFSYNNTNSHTRHNWCFFAETKRKSSHGPPNLFKPTTTDSTWTLQNKPGSVQKGCLNRLYKTLETLEITIKDNCTKGINKFSATCTIKSLYFVLYFVLLSIYFVPI